MLVARQPSFAGGRAAASYFETDFASFLAWRDWGFPDRGVFNGFGMGALRCADGAFVVGEMAAHTANAGRIYFPGGTPDPNDIAGDTVDIAWSIAREIEEETGLTPADYRAEPDWDCVVYDASIAMMRTLHIDSPGEAVKARIEANLARQAHPELSAIHLVRAMSDLTQPARGYSGFSIIPIDLTFNLGLRIDTAAGGFTIGLANLIGFIPIRSGTQ